MVEGGGLEERTEKEDTLSIQNSKSACAGARALFPRFAVVIAAAASDDPLHCYFLLP